MIAPDKHLDLNHCVIRAGAELLAYLKRSRVAKFETLRSHLIKKMGVDADVIFHATLNFLFLLGRIEYHAHNDRFEYTGDSSAQVATIKDVNR